MTSTTRRSDKRTATPTPVAADEPTATILPPISDFGAGAFADTPPPPPHKLPKMLPSLSADLLAHPHAPAIGDTRPLPPILPRPQDDVQPRQLPPMSSTPPPSVGYPSSSSSPAAGTPLSSLSSSASSLPQLALAPIAGDRPSMLPAGTRQERDAARRDTHKEIERRRRLTINHDIEELARLVGATKESKHAVLRRSLDYMHQLIAENHQLRSQLEQLQQQQQHHHINQYHP